MDIKVLILSLGMSTSLIACGGSSSSGVEPIEIIDLTFCVSEIVDVRVIRNDLLENDITFRDYSWTNGCEVDVNLAYGFLTAGSIEVVPLARGETFTESTSSTYSYVACRPPSIGIDSDDSVGLQLGCS